YEGPDGDINLAPLQKFEFYEYQKNHYLIPHLGNSEQWANTLFFGSDQQVKLSLEIGGEPGYELISDPLQVGTWAFEGIERGTGFVRLLNHTENPTLGNDAYWNGIFEFARRDGIAGSAAIAPIPYRTTPGSTSLILPHVAKDQENFWTGYSLLNPGNTTTLVQGVAYGYQGEVLAQTDFLLPPQTQDIRIIQKLFPSLPIPTIAWIRFTSETPICGIELFGSPNPKKGYLAGFELAPSSRLAQLLLFPAVGFDSDRVTGLSLVNPHSQSISIEIALCQDVLGGDNLVQLGNYQIPAFGKWTALLDDLRQNSGIPHSQMRAIRVYSNLPITGFVLIANNELTQLGGYLGIPGSPD
ncbi:MAG: hypothetical protein KDC71_24070, partial [Acidobacteria bacterium]|nr:hypothetical protein [Acidobacteriota bacterium]